MPIFFKDFDKETSDQLNKQFIGKDGSAWKVESKYKGPWDTLYINPQADSKGVTVDVEYNLKAAKLKTKTNVNTNLEFKPKVTFEDGAHKVEVSTKSDVRNLDYEATYELKEKGFAANAKVNQKAVEAAGVLSVAHHCVVGGGAEYDLTGKGNLSWAAGARYNRPGTTASLTTANLKSFAVALRQKFDLLGKDLFAAVQVSHSKDSGLAYKAGLETQCPLGTGHTIKVRMDNKFAVGVAASRDIAVGWRYAVGWECQEHAKFGVVFTREGTCCGHCQ